MIESVHFHAFRESLNRGIVTPGEKMRIAAVNVESVYPSGNSDH
jgi:hypothetical protein